MEAELRQPGAIARAILLEDPANRDRFGAAMDLLDAGATLVGETGRERLQGERVLLTAQATRAVHTFEVVVAACMIGRGVQAAMSNRACAVITSTTRPSLPPTY